MASRISVSCPGCLAKLNLSDSSKLGKKIKCPKCSDVFVAEADEDEDMDDLEMDEEEARPKASGGRKRGGGGGGSAGGSRGKKAGGKKGKSSGGNSGPMIAIGAVAVIALIGVGLFASGVFNSAPQPMAAQPANMTPIPMTSAPAAAHGADPATSQPTAMAAHAAPTMNAATPTAPPAAPTTPAVTPPAAVNLSERHLALRWMPADTEVIVHLKFSELWKSPLLKDLTENFFTTLVMGQLQERTGLAAADIESITLGVADTKAIQAAGISRAMGLPVTPTLPKAVAVVRTTKPISLDQVLKSSPELKPAEYGTQKFFEVVTPTDDKKTQPFGGWLADPNTLIVTSIEDLKAIIDRKEPVTPRKELQIVDPTSHLIVVVAPKDPKSLTQQAPIPPAPPGVPPELQAMEKALRESTRSVGVGINLRGGFDLRVAVQLADASSTAQVKAGVDVGIAQGREQFAPMKAMPLGGLGDQLLNSLKVETKDQVVTISAGLPDSAQKDIELALQMASTFFASKPAARNVAGQPQMQQQAEPFAAVTPEEFNGLPDGLTIMATSYLTRSIHTSKTLLELAIILEGELPAKICGYGQMNLKTIALPNGTALKIDTNEPGLRDVRSKAMFPLSADDSYIFRTYGSHVYLRQLLEVPRESAEEIQTVQGSFKLLTYEGSEDFTVKDVAKTAKRPLTDPALKAAGVKLIPTFRGAGIEELKLSCNDGFFLGTARADIPDDPNKNDPRFDSDRFSFHPVFEKNRNVQSFMPSVAGSTGANMDVQFTLYRGVKERTVTFKFAGVPLPHFDGEKIAAQEKTRRKPGVLTPEEAFTFNYAGPTEPVKATAEGLPDSATVTSRLAWGRDSAAPDGRKLKVLLQLQGEGMKGVCGYGNLEMQPLALDEGTSLTVDKKEDRSFLPHSASGPTMKPFTFSSEWGTNPPGTLLVLIPYDYPPKAALNVRELQGTIKVLTFESSKEITINDAPVKAKQPLTDPDLVAAGIKLTSSKVHDKFELLTLTHNKDYFVSMPTVSYPGDPDPDERKMGFFQHIQDDKSTLEISSAIRDQAAKFPTKMRIHFTLYSGLKERTISFKFADLPLPDRNVPFNKYPGTE